MGDDNEEEDDGDAGEDEDDDDVVEQGGEQGDDEEVQGRLSEPDEHLFQNCQQENERSHSATNIVKMMRLASFTFAEVERGCAPAKHNHGLDTEVMSYETLKEALKDDSNIRCIVDQEC